MFGRYSHLVRAVNDRRLELQDTVLEARVASLRAWIPVRSAVFILFSIGAAATVLSAFAKVLPGGIADRIVVTAIALSSAFTVVLTVAYYFLTRLLAQLEIDILMLLTLDHRKR